MFTHYVYFDRENYNIENDEEMMTEVNAFLNNYNMEVVDHEKDNDGYCVLLRDKVSGEEFWVDLWDNCDDEEILNCDWNEWIFITYDTRDMARKYVMNDSDFASECFCLAENCVFTNYKNKE